MWTNPMQIADLVTFTEEIFHGKLHFFYALLVALCRTIFFKKRMFCIIPILLLHPTDLWNDEHNYFWTFSTDLLASYFVENLPAVAYIKMLKGCSLKVNLPEKIILDILLIFFDFFNFFNFLKKLIFIFLQFL